MKILLFYGNNRTKQEVTIILSLGTGSAFPWKQ